MEAGKPDYSLERRKSGLQPNNLNAARIRLRILAEWEG